MLPPLAKRHWRAVVALRLLLALPLCADASAWQAGISLQNEISWTPTAGNDYQVQWSPPSGEESWANLGPAVPGAGTNQSALDPSRGGARRYRVMETVPASGEVFVMTNALANANPGFESGAAGWSLASMHSISTTEAKSGTSSLRSHIPGGATGGQLAKTIPTVLPGTSYTVSFHAKQISAGTSYVQQYRIEWIAVGGAMTAGSWINFAGGNGAWTKITGTAVTAPGNAVSARIVFYFATGAVAGAVGEVFLDDVEFAHQVSAGPATPEETRQITSVTRRVARLAWPSIPGVAYRIEERESLASDDWAIIATVTGQGGETYHHAPAAGTQRFYRVSRTALLPDAPPNVRIVQTGIQASISVAWGAVPSPGVTGYRVLYGTSPENLDQFMDVGNVQSATLPDLAPGLTYYISVLTLSADGAGPAGTTIVEAQPESGPAFLPLFTVDTILEPDPVFETSTARITRLADRARDRHAREGLGFLISSGPVVAAAYKYDHYLPFYWEQRVAQIEIIDEVAKGGNKVVFNFTTQARLNPAEFRTFFNVGSPLSGYHNNQSDFLNAGVSLVSTNASVRYPGETDFNYTSTIAQKIPEYRPLRIGDRMEVELSQFLLNPRNGRNNYYGTAFLYVVGRGVVPWYGEIWEAAATKVVGVTSFDSFPLPEEAWLGGLTTLPYQYSNEPQHRFKQMAGNITPENGQPFLLGRRIHHTDFRTGAHSEQGNPVFAEQIGKVGPKFVAQSCVACHVNNGRSLLPALGSTLDQAVVKVGASADGELHPLLGEQIQPYAIDAPPEAGVVLSAFTEIAGTYGDGTPYTLRQPQVQFSGVTPTFYSLRMATQLVGLGLLEAVPESAILALADPEDANGDGISGRAHYVPAPENPSILRLGRFGHKATQPTVLHQIAYAFNRDMDVTSSMFPVLDGENSPRPPEIAASQLDQINRYVSLLGVGAQRDIHDPEVIRGRQLFTTASCVACHSPGFTTSPYHPMGELRSQVIHPYTDLLLHDMGPGLASNMGEEGASGSEWRTSPLWNIGLSEGVSGGPGYLHDGRARTIEEAILWHGGEAEQAKENFRTMPATDRGAILKFIRSL